jgi:hypothetical protein
MQRSGYFGRKTRKKKKIFHGKQLLKSEHYTLWLVGKCSLYYYICLVGLLELNILVFEKCKEGMIVNQKEDQHKNKKHLIFRP